MATYKKNGARQVKVDRDKSAIKQLHNFSNIIEGMQRLNTLIEEYPGHLTEDNIISIAEDLNKQNNLKLEENQIKIVVNRFITPKAKVSDEV